MHSKAQVIIIAALIAAVAFVVYTLHKRDKDYANFKSNVYRIMTQQLSYIRELTIRKCYDIRSCDDILARLYDVNKAYAECIESKHRKVYDQVKTLQDNFINCFAHVIESYQGDPEDKIFTDATTLLQTANNNIISYFTKLKYMDVNIIQTAHTNNLIDQLFAIAQEENGIKELENCITGLEKYSQMLAYNSVDK